MPMFDRSSIVTRNLRVMHSRAASAFTLMELMVSISILIIIILGVGVMFQGASKTVGNSQGLMDTMSSVRAVQGLMERDISGIDKNGFLVIRSRLQRPDTTQIPGLGTTTY